MVSKKMSHYLNEKSSLVITDPLPLSSQLICPDHNQWLQAVPHSLWHWHQQSATYSIPPHPGLTLVLLFKYSYVTFTDNTGNTIHSTRRGQTIKQRVFSADNNFEEL